MRVDFREAHENGDKVIVKMEERKHGFSYQKEGMYITPITSSKACGRRSFWNMGCYARLPCGTRSHLPMNCEEDPDFKRQDFTTLE